MNKKQDKREKYCRICGLRATYWNAHHWQIHYFKIARCYWRGDTWVVRELSRCVAITGQAHNYSLKGLSSQTWWWSVLSRWRCLQDRLTGPYWSIYKLSDIRSEGDLSKGTHIEQSYCHSNNNSEFLLGIRVSASSVLYCVFTYLSINISFIYQPLEIVLWANTLKLRLTSASAATLKKAASARLIDNSSLCAWRIKGPTTPQPGILQYSSDAE
jgi:hypothetical protein